MTSRGNPLDSYMPNAIPSTITSPSSRDEPAQCDSRRTNIAPVAGGPPLFGKYEVTQELGEGGMGRVYRAIDRELGRSVAIKVLKSVDAFESSRFRGEAELIAQLNHPNIVKIFDIQNTPDGRPYLVLELAEGGSLDKELQGHPQVPRRAAETVEILASAVQYAFDEKKVIHRDLKPANILRGKDGVLKITDFGLAKQLEMSSGMTPSGAVMGTPSYMAPEQANGKIKEFGPEVDVYGLGAILYEMLTGRPPFRGVNIVETLEQVRWSDPAPPSRLVPRLPRDLSTICLKCLQKTPQRRYRTAGELATDLRRWLNGETIIARPAPSWERAWRQIRRRPWQTATTVACCLALLLAISGALFIREKAREAHQHRLLEAKDKEAQDRQKEAQATLETQRHENEKRLRDRSDMSLAAVDGIRAMLLTGELKNIQGVGPLKIQLFNYCQQLNKQIQMEPEFDKNRLAMSWFEIGTLMYETGGKEQAREAFIAARDLLRALATDTPENRTFRSRVESMLGRSAFDLRRMAEAETACQQVECLLAELSSAKEPQVLGLLADMWHLRGDLASDKRLLHQAAEAYKEAIKLRAIVADKYRAMTPAELAEVGKHNSALLKVAIEHLRGLARGYGYLGDVLMDARRLGDADKAYWESHRVRELVADTVALVIMANQAGGSDRLTDKDLYEAQLQFGRSWGNLAEVQAYCRVLGTAKFFSEKALKLRREVCAASPNNAEFRRDLCDNLNKLADLKLQIGDHHDVEQLLLESRKVPEDLSVVRKGWSAESESVVAISHLLLAQFYATERAEDARTEVRAARMIVDKLAKQNPADPETAFNQAASYALSAELGGPNHEGERQTALDSLERALKHGYRGKHPEDMKRLRAFQSLVAEPRFVEILKKFRAARVVLSETDLLQSTDKASSAPLRVKE